MTLKQYLAKLVETNDSNVGPSLNFHQDDRKWYCTLWIDDDVFMGDHRDPTVAAKQALADAGDR